jgi:hypothetical protein
MLLGDLGLARLMGAEPPDDESAAAGEDRDDLLLTRTGVVLGTPAYISPEAASGLSVDPRSDLYSLGVVFYELLTGELPFRGGSVGAIILRRLREQPPSPRRVNPRISPAIDSVVVRLLDRDPERRFQSADELLSALWKLGRQKWWHWRRRHELEAEVFQKWLGGVSARSKGAEHDLALRTKPDMDAPATIVESRNDAASSPAGRAERPAGDQREYGDSTAELGLGHSLPGVLIEPTLPAAWLMVPGDDGAETQVRLQGETLIGRDPACDISLTQEWMSRKVSARGRPDSGNRGDAGIWML